MQGEERPLWTSSAESARHSQPATVSLARSAVRGQQVEAGTEQRPVRYHVVNLVGLLGTLARADRVLEAAPGVGGTDHLEDHHWVTAGRPLGIGTQLGPLGDPGVPDLATAAMVDQHADGMLLVAVGEGHGQRLLAA